MRLGALLIGLTLLLAAPAQAQSSRTLDDLDDIAPWAAGASTDVSATISSVAGHDGQALRLDYDFNGRSGYAFASRDLTFRAPDNYEISFWVRGEGPPNTFEVKFTDESGENVHWRQTRRFQFPGGWTLFTIKKRQITWAWGPNPDHNFKGAERIEFVVTAGEGGRGYIQIDDLTLRTLPAEPSTPPRPLAAASSEDGNRKASQSVDDDPQSAWISQGAGAASLTLDLGYEREFGGLTLAWAEGRGASRYRLMASSDNRRWRLLTAVEEGDGGTDWLRTPEASARWLRLDMVAPVARRSGEGQMGAGFGAARTEQPGYGLTDVRIEPLSFGEDENAFLEAVAKRNRRGLYPRGLFGEQPYWTLVGVDGGGESGLISEDGAIELRRGGPSVEPFVLDHGRLVTWADVRIEQTLAQGDLPIPSATWTHDDWTLKVTAMGEGSPDASGLYGRYDLTNTSDRAVRLTLALMARPVQVNGPEQFLAVPGGASPIRQTTWTGTELVLNDATRIRPLVAPEDVRLAGFQSGGDPQSLLARMTSANTAPRTGVDPTGLMAGAMTWTVDLAPGQTRTFGWAAPLAGEPPALPATASVEAAFDTIEHRVVASWREKLDRVDLIVPPEGQRIEDTLKTSLAYMLMSRQGPSLQPGTRSYNRSWIRDGAMMAEGLNRLGHADLSQEYLRWYAPNVFENGKVPCCVDERGADPVPENDSHGEFVFLAAETYRYTGDLTQLRSVWPQVQGAIRYMDALRAETRIAANQTPATRHLYGLLPPSISHEGYSDRAAYSYWDDFWGLLGYRDAVMAAEALGETEAAAAFAASRDEFEADLTASITATAQHHQIDWIAGAADRGDFDATSTTIGLSPSGLTADLPQDLLRRTFDKYWENFSARLQNRTDWRDYTPYELRVVGAFVRLAQPERAMQALDFFMADRRPQAWNGWAEVVGRDLRQPRFIGDMPHAWISSDYIRSVLDLFAYHRDADNALVLAGGLPERWLSTPTGVGVNGLKTPYGDLTYALRRQTGVTTLTLSGAARPPGGFVLIWPGEASPPARVRIDGRAGAWNGRELAIPATARRVDIRQ